MDQAQWDRAVEAAKQQRKTTGIGTLGERTLHSVLKYYFEPDPDYHEISVDSFVADIATPDGIIEIQTRGFDRLRRKLDAFLQHSPVTVVYPIPVVKYLVWIDPATGESTSRRKSPRRGSTLDAAAELYKIKPALTHPNLKICLVLLEMEEYRLKNGWSSDGKKGSTRCERIPRTLYNEIWLRTPADYASLLPSSLPDTFTTATLSQAIGQNRSRCQTFLHLLHYIGAAERVGKQGNAYVYRLAAPFRVLP